MLKVVSKMMLKVELKVVFIILKVVFIILKVVLKHSFKVCKLGAFTKAYDIKKLGAVI